MVSFFKLFLIMVIMEIRSSDSLNSYMMNVRNTPPISRRQEQEYFKMYRSGDLDARNKLIEANLRFVVSVAKEYQDYGLTLLELISEGNLGLFEAVYRFDENKGFKFITYAVWWVRQAILKALAEKSDTVGLPSNRHVDLMKCQRTQLELVQSLGREPTTSEIAEELSYTVTRVENAFGIDGKIVYLDREYGEDGPIPVHTVFGDEHALNPSLYPEEAEIKEIIYGALAEVNGRDREILLDYFGFRGKPLTLEQIGENIGITREGVRQRRNKNLKSIRESLVSRGLELSDFL